MYVFSTNAGLLESDCSYSKFAAYTMLRHEGDFHRAAAALASEGYGTKPAYVLTDAGNADRFVDMFSEKVRFHSEANRFLIYDGKSWAIDKSNQVLTLARQSVDQINTDARAASNDVERATLARFWARSSNVERVKALLTFAKPLLVINSEKLDSDPMLLNCMNGTLNLKTGNLRPHDPLDFITKLVRHDYEPSAKCPTFDSFITRILDTPELRTFVQRAVGYSLTGTQREQVLLVCHGDGDNGKSTLFNTLLKLLGDYAQAVPPELLLSESRGTATPEVTRLKGNRLAVLTETKQGSVINESRVKRLTGGDKLSARTLYQEYIDFDPTHTIWLLTNYKPEIRGQDHAIWRRLKLIPFSVKITEAEKDRELTEKLQKELPGILSWAVRGCLDWLSNGLGEPPAVLEATQDYREEMDQVQEFLTECCQFDPSYEVPFPLLFNGYKKWCESLSYPIGSSKAFGSSLQRKGFVKRRSNPSAKYLGLQLSSG